MKKSYTKNKQSDLVGLENETSEIMNEFFEQNNMTQDFEGGETIARMKNITDKVFSKIKGDNITIPKNECNTNSLNLTLNINL